MSNLERLIKHYMKQAKVDKASPASGYALGVAHTLEIVKELRDGLKDEADELWETRKDSEAPEERKRSVKLIRAIIERIDGIDDPQE